MTTPHTDEASPIEFDDTPLTDEQYMGAIDIILEMCEPHERLPFLKAVLADLTRKASAPSEEGNP